MLGLLSPNWFTFIIVLAVEVAFVLLVIAFIAQFVVRRHERRWHEG